MSHWQEALAVLSKWTILLSCSSRLEPPRCDFVAGPEKEVWQESMVAFLAGDTSEPGAAGFLKKGVLL